MRKNRNGRHTSRPLSLHQGGFLRRVLELPTNDLGGWTIRSFSQLQFTWSGPWWEYLWCGDEWMMHWGFFFLETWSINVQQHITTWVRKYYKCSHYWDNTLELAKNQSVTDLERNSSLTHSPETNVCDFQWNLIKKILLLRNVWNPLLFSISESA